MPKQISEKEFEALIFEHQSLIIKVCDIYTHSQVDKEELFQDIIINLWKGLPTFKEQSKLSTWIYRVGINTAISWSRKKKRNRLVLLEKMQELPSLERPADATDPTRIKALYRAINQLKAVEKAIILLYLEERSYKEIAEIIGISEKNVSVRLVRLKKKLEELLRPMMNINA